MTASPRTRVRRRLASTGAALALTTGLVAAWSTQAPASHAAAPVHGLDSGIFDTASGTFLRAQLDSQSPNYGAFVIAVPGVGLLWPSGSVSVNVNSASDTQLRFDGTGYLDANATLDTEFGVQYGLSGKVTTTPLRLIGHVDPNHHTGNAEIFIAGKHYSLKADQATPSADKVVTAILGDYATQNWTALYALTDTTLRSHFTQDQFSATLVADLAGGRVLSAVPAGAISYTVTAAGTSLAHAPATITSQDSGGTTQTTATTLTLILDAGAWRLLTLT